VTFHKYKEARESAEREHILRALEAVAAIR